MKVEIWSDVVCPWCYIGKRNFETALHRLPVDDHDVDVVFRSFELDPTAPPVRTGTYAERLGRKYGATPEQAEAMIARMVNAGVGAGVELRFDIARPGNTFDAHRLLHFAAACGRQRQLKERLLRATFSEGATIGERATLVRLAAEVGLAADEAAAVLDDDAYAADVRADEQRAADLDITAVPYFVIDGRIGVPGAQPPDVFVKVLTRAWEAPAPRTG